MSVFEGWLYQQITFTWRRTQEPVRTVILADLIGKHDRTVRYALVRLEQRGVVQRHGQRGGWLPGTAA